MRSYKTLLFIGLIFFFGLMTKAETIKIENPVEIKYAQNVDQAIERLSGKVMACVDASGGKTDECMCTECSCKFKAEYTALKQAYKQALETNPGWEDNTVFYQLEGDPMGYNISFAGLKRQFNVKCE